MKTTYTCPSENKGISFPVLRHFGEDGDKKPSELFGAQVPSIVLSIRKQVQEFSNDGDIRYIFFNYEVPSYQITTEVQGLNWNYRN